MEGILAILHFIVWVYAVVKILGSNASSGDKILWVLVVFLLPLIGLIIWLFMGPGSPRK